MSRVSYNQYFPKSVLLPQKWAMPIAKYVLNLANKHGIELLFPGIEFDSLSSK